MAPIRYYAFNKTFSTTIANNFSDQIFKLTAYDIMLTEAYS